MFPVSSRRVKTELEKDDAFSRIKCSEASDKGIDVGYCTARRVKAICIAVGLKSRQNTDGVYAHLR